MSELIDPPDPEPVIDRGRLEDEAYERAVDEELWTPQAFVVEPIVETPPKPALVTRSCPFCLDGRVILSGYRIAKCGCCNGRGYYVTEEDA